MKDAILKTHNLIFLSHYFSGNLNLTTDVEFTDSESETIKQLPSFSPQRLVLQYWGPGIPVWGEGGQCPCVGGGQRFCLSMMPDV